MERDLQWYKHAKRGDTYYDVSNTTVRKMTYIGYYIDERDVTWIVHAGGISKLNDNMFPETEYHEMIKHMQKTKQIKILKEIQSLNTKIQKLTSDLGEVSNYESFRKSTSELDFTTDKPFDSIPEFAMELAANGIETNLK